MNLRERPFLTLIFFVTAVVTAALAAGCRKGPQQPITVVVRVETPGASASEVDAQALSSLAERLYGLDGVRDVRTIATPGLGTILVEVDPALGDAAPQTVRGGLGDSASLSVGGAPILPIVSVAAPRSMRTILRSTSDVGTMRDVEETVIRPRLLATPGVRDMSICGGGEREVQVVVDPLHLAALGLTVPELAAAIASFKLDLPAGGAGGTVAVLGDGGGAGSLSDLAIVERAGATIRLRDVAQVTIGSADPDCVAMGPQGTFMESRVGYVGEKGRDGVRKAVTELAATLPQGMTLSLVDDVQSVAHVELPPGDVRGNELVAGRILRALEPVGDAYVLFHAPTDVDIVMIHMDEGKAIEALAGVPGIGPVMPESAVSIEITGPDPAAVEAGAKALREKLAADARIAAVAPAASQHPVLAIKPDRERAAQLGVRASDIASTVEAAGVGLRAGTLIDDGRSLPIRIRVPTAPAAETLPDVLQSLRVRTADQNLVPLSSVASISEDSGPAEIRRHRGAYAAVVQVRPATSRSAALAAARRAAKDLAAPLHATIQ